VGDGTRALADVLGWVILSAVGLVVLWVVVAVALALVWGVGRLAGSEPLEKPALWWITWSADVRSWLTEPLEGDGDRGTMLLALAALLAVGVALLVLGTIGWPLYFTISAAVGAPIAVLAMHRAEGDLLRERSISRLGVVGYGSLLMLVMWAWITFAAFIVVGLAVALVRVL
jgi:hypothetical protein